MVPARPTADNGPIFYPKTPWLSGFVKVGVSKSTVLLRSTRGGPTITPRCFMGRILQADRDIKYIAIGTYNKSRSMPACM